VKRYVIAFAWSVHAPNEVVLIERTKNDWQRGKLNLPGGSIEPGESVIAAAVRELREETSIVASEMDVKHLGVIACEGWSVDVCFCPYRIVRGGEANTARTMCPDEGNIITVPVREALADPRLMPNLQIIIPLCRDRLSGWRLSPTSDDYSWIVNVRTEAPTEVSQLLQPQPLSEGSGGVLPTVPCRSEGSEPAAGSSDGCGVIV
jgi:8-oxo-dGTP pyrophosphatase MutT (NUDIX family)